MRGCLFVSHSFPVVFFRVVVFDVLCGFGVCWIVVLCVLLWVSVVMCLVPICHVGVLPTLVSCWFRFALFVLVGIALCWCPFRVDVYLVSFRSVLCWCRFVYVCCCVLLPGPIARGTAGAAYLWRSAWRGTTEPWRSKVTR